MKFDLQYFAYDGNIYCDFNSTSAQATAGSNILLAIYDADGTTLYAVAGQQGLTISRSADSIEVSSKDTVGGWKSKIPGMKEWTIDTDGVYVMSDESHKILGEAFLNGDQVCVKIINANTKENLWGGLGAITTYDIEAPYDDAMTYSITIEGNGALSDISEKEGATDWPTNLGDGQMGE